MKRSRLRVPDEIEMRGCPYELYASPLHWTVDEHKGLSCDRCNRPLTFRFAYRETAGARRDDPRWWVPTGVKCRCGVEIAVRAMPRFYRKRRTDSRQPELNFAPQRTTDLFPDEKIHHFNHTSTVRR